MKLKRSSNVLLGNVLIRFFVMVIFLSAAFGIPASSSAEASMDHFVVHQKGRFYELKAADLNQDGLKDIYAGLTEGAYPNFKRSLVVLFQKEGGKFNSQPDQIISLDPRAAVADAADVLPSPGMEILVLDDRGVSASALTGNLYGPMTRIVERPTLASVADPQVTPLWDFARDFDGDGKDEILILGTSNAALYNDPNGPPQTLSIAPVSRVRTTNLPGTAVESKITVPELNPLDFNGDGLTDIVAFVEDNISVFLQKANGDFPENPDHFISLNVWPEKVRMDREVHSITFGLAPDFYLLAGDYDGDRKADFMAMTLTGGIIGLTSKARLYFGRDKNLLEGKPSQVIELENAGAGPFFTDFDRDGKMEFVLTYMSMGVSSAAKIVIGGKAEVISKCYRLSPDGLYPEKPTFIYKSTPKADFKTITIEGTLPILGGDFNGDKKLDILQGFSKDSLSIILNQQGGFEQDPALTLPVPSPRQLNLNPLIVDLNADGLDEFAVVYPQLHEHSGELHIVINRGGW